MKKIIFLRTNPGATGGAERYLSRLSKALSLINIPNEIRSFRGGKPFFSWQKALKFNTQVCAQKKDDEFYFSLERVECADIYRAGDGVHKVYRALKPFWWVNPLNFIYVYLEKRCFENAQKIIANSNFIRSQIIKTYAIDEQKITTIYNGVNLPNKVEKGRAKMELCAKLGLNHELPIILFVGSGFKRKGVSEFLEILSKLEAKFNAIIIGGDKKLKHYRAKAKKLGVNAMFMGIENNVSRFYEASEVFLFPTHYEPFSNVVLEAMSYGCVAITTAQNGASEIIKENFVMKKPDDYEICVRIDEILNNPEIFYRYSQENIVISKNFSIEKNAALTMEVIDVCVH